MANAEIKNVFGFDRLSMVEGVVENLLLGRRKAIYEGCKNYEVQKGERLPITITVDFDENASGPIWTVCKVEKAGGKFFAVVEQEDFEGIHFMGEYPLENLLNLVGLERRSDESEFLPGSDEWTREMHDWNFPPELVEFYLEKKLYK